MFNLFVIEDYSLSTNSCKNEITKISLKVQKKKYLKNKSLNRGQNNYTFSKIFLLLIEKQIKKYGSRYT